MEELKINKLLILDENDLYFELGRELGYVVLGIESEQKKRGISGLAREWYTTHKQQIKELVCSSDKIQIILSDAAPISITKIIADIIATNYLGFPAIEIAVIIFREGVNKICNENESQVKR